jgi:hypothetical protein
MDGWSAGLEMLSNIRKNCGYWSKIGWLISGDPTHINSSPCGQQHLTTSNYQSNLNVKKKTLHIWMVLKFRMHFWGYLRMVFNQLFFFCSKFDTTIATYTTQTMLSCWRSLGWSSKHLYHYVQWQHSARTLLTKAITKHVANVFGNSVVFASCTLKTFQDHLCSIPKSWGYP